MRLRPYIVSVGEALVDFVSTEIGPLEHSPGFVKRVGGESANVAVGLAKLGARSAFVGRVGGDAFGRFLVEELRRHGVDVSGLKVDGEHRTRLAFVSRTKSGEREFDFWEMAPASSHLRWSDIPLDTLMKARFVNIAPLLLLREPSRSTAFRIAEHARNKGLPVAFDANVRLNLWSSAAEAKRITKNMIRLSTIVRVNEDEAYFLTGTRDWVRAGERLRAWGPTVAAITMGPRGCFIQTRHREGYWHGFNVRALDTTGCGDAFFAALLHGVASRNVEPGDIPREDWNVIAPYANAVGALTALKPGGADAIPTPEEVEQFTRRYNN